MRSTAQEPVRCALKEWASLCRALARGQLSVLLRKGGLHDPRRDAGAGALTTEPPVSAPAASTFSLRRRFALHPTYFHLRAPDRVRELRPSARAQPEPVAPALEAVAALAAAWWIDQVEPLHRLADAGALLLSRDGVDHRFAPNPRARRRELQRPGAWLLLLRVDSLPRAVALADVARPEAARGCSSWIEFETPITPTDTRPALPDAIHEQRAHGLRARLGAPDVI
ncbi:MAG: DUF1802 family protein [Myxococcales bacterium]|nr:DUF1802 family protein [Myxococcales bacterium]